MLRWLQQVRLAQLKCSTEHASLSPTKVPAWLMCSSVMPMSASFAQSHSSTADQHYICTGEPAVLSEADLGLGKRPKDPPQSRQPARKRSKKADAAPAAKAAVESQPEEPEAIKVRLQLCSSVQSTSLTQQK